MDTDGPITLYTYFHLLVAFALLDTDGTKRSHEKLDASCGYIESQYRCG